MRPLLTILAIVVGNVVFCQELKELRHARTDEFKCDFYVLLSDKNKKLKYEDTLHYYWFKSQAIHITQGNSSGNVLNGPFTKYFHSNQLAEKGQFEQGLKDGEWKQWYESGKLKAIYNYNDGVLAGSYTLFNEAGDVREQGKFRGGDKKVKFQKNKKEKPKKKRDWSGTIKTSPEKKAAKEERKRDRKEKREARKIRRKKEGNFIQRFIKKLKNRDKKPNKKKGKKNKEKS